MRGNHEARQSHRVTFLAGQHRLPQPEFSQGIFVRHDGDAAAALSGARIEAMEDGGPDGGTKKAGGRRSSYDHRRSETSLPQDGAGAGRLRGRL